LIAIRVNEGVAASKMVDCLSNSLENAVKKICQEN
jgi:hypothetical protein